MLFACCDYWELMIHFHSNITETKFSSLSRSDLGSQKDVLSNGRTEVGNHQAPVNNGIPKAFGSSTLAPPASKMSQMVTTAIAISNNDPLRISALPGERDIKSKTENKM